MDANFVLFGSYAANLLAQFADGYLTAVGIDHGMKEGNPIGRWMFDNIGRTGTNAIKIGAVPFALLLIDAYGGFGGWMNGLVAAGTIPVVIWNFLLLKKNKISVKW